MGQNRVFFKCVNCDRKKDLQWKTIKWLGEKIFLSKEEKSSTKPPPAN